MRWIISELSQLLARDQNEGSSSPRRSSDWTQLIIPSGKLSDPVTCHKLIYRNYRMQILLELKKDLEEELELMNEFARENLKSYQVW
jgi:hypothetical protein